VTKRKPARAPNRRSERPRSREALEFARRLRELCAEAEPRLSPNALALRVPELGRRTVYHAWAGDVAITLDVAAALAAALGVPLAEMLPAD